ncbi:hypothetical protein ET495_05960 [Xylanimonas allomyrinae]|uniref:Nucleotidyl transferase AbiEii/AbiGii toxin family protein n=1 Tax=Xylanimonas allomyrinae TaxID=2509459 RepID=A0A4P6EKD9_9MICO|nr:nucleotidyl transferase AbiEii/AbiGii toxin family protein [Xylanimonas allomyrinae]QAY62865.1 hypothetical protein ET495_05960 [Xylanimonas allomyrinae]
MSDYEPHITVGHIVRHAGQSGSAGREAAIMDVAQDLLLRHLHDLGLLDELAFKGGTSLRKFYAGQAGRFSIDLDFSVADIGTPTESVVDLLREAIEGLRLGVFSYAITERRGKPSLVVESTFGTTGTLDAKLDVNPPPWLEPEARPWVPLPIHSTYGGPLPLIKSVRIEENVAEKIARLNRTTTARDVYDLVWIREHFRSSPAEWCSAF